MSTIMSQVACSLCNMKVDEIKWNEHLVCMSHLQLCKDNKAKLQSSFFEKIFNACPNKSGLYNFKFEETHHFWQLHFPTKLKKEKFSKLCSDSINNSVLGNSLSTDFNDFLSNVTPIIGKTYSGSMKVIQFCKTL